jgi:NTP pyrophosphatase (non-canonical NTP hydrolase)
MNLYEYQIEAMTFAPPDTLGDQVHGLVVTALGLSGESTELDDALNWVHPDWIKEVTKEAGDCCWYVARGCAALGVEMGGVFSNANYISIKHAANLSTTEWDGYRFAPVLLKIAAQFGEVVKKIYAQGHEVDQQKLVDLLVEYWVLLEIFADFLGIPISDILEANIAKLRERFPDGFTVEASVGRVEA